LVAGRFVDPDALLALLSRQVEEVVGVESASEIVDVVEEATRPDLSGPTAIVGLGAILFAATGGFLHLQEALNRAWGVAPDPRRSSVRVFFVKRAISMIMLASIGLVLVSSMLLSTALAVFEDMIQRYAPSWIGPWTLTAADWLASLGLIGLLFMLMLKYLPDAEVRWRDAAVGALFTALLFTVGKQLIGLYLGRSDPGNVFGAAGSLAVALLWIYYSAIILLLGAEFTEVWATRRGDPVVPQKGAVRVVRQYGPGPGGSQGMQDREEVERELAERKRAAKGKPERDEALGGAGRRDADPPAGGDEGGESAPRGSDPFRKASR